MVDLEEKGRPGRGRKTTGRSIRERVVEIYIYRLFQMMGIESESEKIRFNSAANRKLVNEIPLILYMCICAVQLFCFKSPFVQEKQIWFQRSNFYPRHTWWTSGLWKVRQLQCWQRIPKGISFCIYSYHSKEFPVWSPIMYLILMV